jgi:orotate phosphoribosyltransferase
MRHYLDYARAREMYKRAKLALKKYKGQYDSIAFMGMSGALIAVPIAQSLRKPLIMVRKNIKDCHSRCTVEGNIACKNYIIIDDLICSGDTVKRVQKKIFEWAPRAHCVGVLEVNYISEHYADGTVLNTRYNLDLDV